MNVKRFAARTSREALALVRQAFGVDAVVLSTKPCAEGIEVLAMAPDSVAGLERLTATPEETAPRRARAAPQRAAAPAAAQNAALAGAQRELANRMGVPKNEVEADADQLAMSTLSFQDYVRDRMLKRRHAELHNHADGRHAGARAWNRPAARWPRPAPRAPRSPAPPRASSSCRPIDDANDDYFDAPAPAPQRRAAPQQRVEPTLPPQRAERPAPQSFANVPELHDEYVEEPRAAAGGLGDAPGRRGHAQQPHGHGQRAALDEGPDRGALRRPGLHGEAAAPAAPGAARAEAAGRRLLAGADPQDGRRAARRRSPTRTRGPPACSNATC